MDMVSIFFSFIAIESLKEGEGGDGKEETVPERREKGGNRLLYFDISSLLI